MSDEEIDDAFEDDDEDLEFEAPAVTVKQTNPLTLGGIKKPRIIFLN